MIILHISPIDTDSVNGLRFSVPGLIDAQIRQNQTVGCMNIHHTDHPFDFPLFEMTDIRNLPKPFNRPDIVVFHGVYWMEYLRLYRQLNCPYIIVPRSSLTRQAQNQAKWKKRLGHLLGFGRFIKNSAIIHMLNPDEAEQSSWISQPMFIAANGMDVPDTLEKNRSSDFIRFATYGRYDINHKGLDLLIEAIKSIEKPLRENNVQFHFYGSDHKNNKAAFLSMVGQTTVKDLIFIHDAVYDRAKHDVLCMTDIFISASRFEGHPMAVLEAMAYGIPCILTPGTNMIKPCVSADAGWGCTQDPVSIASAILTALSQRDTWSNKGHNARNLIRDQYSWDMIGKQTLKVYEEEVRKVKQGEEH